MSENLTPPPTEKANSEYTSTEICRLAYNMMDEQSKNTYAQQHLQVENLNLSESFTDLGTNTDCKTNEGASENPQPTSADNLYTFINIDITGLQQIDKLLTHTESTTPPPRKINLSTGKDIRFYRQIPTAYDTCDAVINLHNLNTPTELPIYIHQPPEIEGEVAASFTSSKTLVSPLDTPKQIFDGLFPNLPLVGHNATRLFTDIDRYARTYVSLQIHLELMQLILHNPTVILPASTGFFCQHLPTAVTSQYTSFGHTKEVNAAYHNLMIAYITNVNYTIKQNTITRHRQELDETHYALTTLANQTPREWAAILTTPTPTNRPPIIAASAVPPITIDTIHMIAAHTIIRDSVYYSPSGGAKHAQSVIDQYLIATNQSEMQLTIKLPIYNDPYIITIQKSPTANPVTFPLQIAPYTIAANTDIIYNVAPGVIPQPINLYPHDRLTYTHNATLNPPKPSPTQYHGFQALYKEKKTDNNTNIYKTPTTQNNPQQQKPTLVRKRSRSPVKNNHTHSTSKTNTNVYCNKYYKCVNWLHGRCRFYHDLTPTEFRSRYGRDPEAVEEEQNMSSNKNQYKVNYPITINKITQHSNNTLTTSIPPHNNKSANRRGTLKREKDCFTCFDLPDMQLTNKSIFNLSTTTFPPEVLDALALNLNFIPIPKNQHPSQLLDSHNELARNIRLNKYFMHSDATTNPTIQTLKRRCNIKSTWEPPPAGQHIEQYISHSRKALESFVEHILTTYTHNQSPKQPKLLNALLQIKNNPSIIIKSADKNLGPVILDKQTYIDISTNASNLGDTNTYRKLAFKPSWEPAKRQLIIILTQHKHITRTCNKTTYSELATTLLNEFDNTKQHFAKAYFNPKMHKPNVQIANLKMRPINSTIGTPTYATSTYLDIELQPYLKLIPTHINNATDILLQIQNKHFPPDTAFLAADVESLYPSIPTTDGLIKLESFLRRHYCKEEKINLILSLAQWVLTNNLLEFNNEYYLQISGTAMGTPFAVTYACIFLAELEHELIITLTKIVSTDTNFYLPLLIFRYIDDIFGIFRNTHSAELFNYHYSQLKPYINLTSEISSTIINVLDITLYTLPDFVTTGTIHTTLYQKPHNKFLFIPPYSFHHNNLSWVQEYVNRIQLYCSEKSQSTYHIQNLKTRLTNRGYRQETINPYLWPNTRDKLIEKAQRKRNNRNTTTDNKPPPIFKLTNTPLTLGANADLKNILQFTNYSLVDPEMEIITQKRNTPIICTSRPNNIANMLLRAKL